MIGFNQPKIELAKHQDGKTEIVVTATKQYVLRLFPDCGCTVVAATVTVSTGTTVIPVNIRGRVLDTRKRIVVHAFDGNNMHKPPLTYNIYVDIIIK